MSDARTTLEKSVLLFVYNADGGALNLAFDVAHKILSPETYNCNLCALTHGAFAMKDEWWQYLDALDARTEFLHADEFKTRYPSEIAENLPAVFKVKDDKLELMISADEINSCHNLSDLKQIINARL